MVAQKIEIVDVASSNLSGIGYNPVKQILAIRFKSGEVFHYAGATEALMARFYGAESLGRFYASEIRGKLTGQKMTGECFDCGAHGWIGERCEDCGCSFYRDQREKKGGG